MMQAECIEKSGTAGNDKRARTVMAAIAGLLARIQRQTVSIFQIAVVVHGNITV
jgi:hypothetical protein